MKLPVRILLMVLCAAIILSLPFAISSPAMLSEAQWEATMALEGDEAGLLRFLVPTAFAEDSAPVYTLPYDFSAAPAPKADGYTENGYSDASITVEMETREDDGVIWRIAWVEIQDPSQLRVTLAGDFNKKGVYTSTKTAKVKAMAQKSNAIVALNGDYFADDQVKRSFELRMFQPVNSKVPKTNKTKDILIIDEFGDFHTFIKSEGITVNKNAKLNESLQDNITAEGVEGRILHAFTFGPALVQDGNPLEMDTKYGYNPNGREPRSAIGQMGPLSYVMVVAEGRGESVGVTHQELADFMFLLGCEEAYNLDGGGTAAMYYNGGYFNDLAGNERDVSDIIYFASAVTEE